MSACETLFAQDVAEADKTNETYYVSNSEFMLAVFGDEFSNARPIVVSFPGNPERVRYKSRIGRAWQGGREAADGMPADTNNFFSLATFSADHAGKFRRQNEHFQALHAIILDDVAVNGYADRLALAPSWVLETSPDNYQVGYLLNQPLQDAGLADRLTRAVGAAGPSGRGSSTRRGRLARLPCAVNGQHTPPFICRMVAWSPQVRYSVEELVAGLRLEMASPGRAQRQKPFRAQERPRIGDPVLIPRAEQNAVLCALHHEGLYKAALTDGKHDITCPWRNEHTDELDADTAYFEPNENSPIGRFDCLHSHCADRNIGELLRFLNVESDASSMLATIRVVPGAIHLVVDAGERELAHAGTHYQRGGLIVTVITDPTTRETRIQEISPLALVRALAGAANWERFDARSECYVRIDPPARHAGVLYDSNSYAHMPVLRGLARQPYLRGDVSLMMNAGYDASTGMFGAFDPREFSIPESPTRADAQSALLVLEDLLKEFRFKGDVDRAAALAAILTAASRPSLAHAPMFHVRAHMVGSGKSYLCELITAFATPQQGTPTTFPAEDEECRKLLLAELMRAPAVIVFDNLTGDLVAHTSLCTILTSEHFTGRILGISKTATVTTRTLFLSSGNNVGPVQDMGRRCISVHLDPGCEVPAARDFTRPALVEDVRRERGRFVSAALTIIRAYFVAGSPQSRCKSLAGFSEWSSTCRQPLCWLGLSDPAASIFDAMAEDPDRETLDRLLTAWKAALGPASAMIRDAVRQANASGDIYVDLREVLHDIAGDRNGEINRRRLGRWIARYAGRIVNGRRFVRSSGHHSAESWRVESVSSVFSVSSGSTEESVNVADYADAYHRVSNGE